MALLQEIILILIAPVGAGIGFVGFFFGFVVLMVCCFGITLLMIPAAIALNEKKYERLREHIQRANQQVFNPLNVFVDLKFDIKYITTHTHHRGGHGHSRTRKLKIPVLTVSFEGQSQMNNVQPSHPVPDYSVNDVSQQQPTNYFNPPPQTWAQQPTYYNNPTRPQFNPQTPPHVPQNQPSQSMKVYGLYPEKE